MKRPGNWPFIFYIPYKFPKITTLLPNTVTSMAHSYPTFTLSILKNIYKHKNNYYGNFSYHISQDKMGT